MNFVSRRFYKSSVKSATAPKKFCYCYRRKEDSTKKVTNFAILCYIVVHIFFLTNLSHCFITVEATLFNLHNNNNLQAPANTNEASSSTTEQHASFATFQNSHDLDESEPPPIRKLNQVFNSATDHAILKNDKKVFVVELLKLLHEQYTAAGKDGINVIQSTNTKVGTVNEGNGDEKKDITESGEDSTTNTVSKKEDRITATRQSTMMSQLLGAISADGDMRRLIDWVQNSFNLASIGELTTQFVVSKLGSVNCAAILKPDKEELLIPRFLLFNEHFVDVPFELPINPSPLECLSHGKFDPVKKTMVIIHGYLAGYTLVDGLTNIKNRILDLNRIVQERANRVFMEAANNNGSYVLTDDLELKLRQQQYNVIIIDWFNGANPVPRSRYIRAAVNAQVVGQLIARFLSALVVQCRTPASNIQIIAHSLGCHVAGFTGKAMRSAGHRLGKITHLDPIGLCFGRMFSEPQFRLSPNDALDTHAVHVSLNLFDNPLDGAQSNFLVNGGRDQIGCGGQSELKNSTSSSVSLLWDSEAKFVPCSHVRALALFEDDLSSEPNQCQIVGYRCSNYENFLAGKCGKCDSQNNQCRLMSIPPLFTNFNKLTFQRPFQVEKVQTTYITQTLPTVTSTTTTTTSYTTTTTTAPPKDVPQLHAIQGEFNDTTTDLHSPYRQANSNNNNKHNKSNNSNNLIAHSTKLVNLVNQISNGSIAWIVDDKELNQKIGNTIARLKPDIVLSEKEDKANKLIGREDNEIKRMDRKLTNDQRERLVQTIDKIKSDTKQAFSGVGWFNTFKINDVDMSKYKVSSFMKQQPSSSSNQYNNHLHHHHHHQQQQQQQLQQNYLNHLTSGNINNNHFLSPTLANADKLSIQASQQQSINIYNKPDHANIKQPTIIQAQDVESLLEPSIAPLGGQALPAGSSNGPLYYIGTGPVSPYCVNYYQFRLLIAESRINRLLMSNSLAPNQLGEVAGLASNVAKLFHNELPTRNNLNNQQQQQREHSSSPKDKLHLTIKLSDVSGHFFKGFTLVEDARYLLRKMPPSPVDSRDNKFGAGNENMVELTMLLNTTKSEPVKIGEAIISYYFHKIVLADSMEVNYMSNISPDVRARYSSTLCPVAINDRHQLVRYVECNNI